MPNDLDYLKMQIAAAPTPHDLHNLATSNRSRRVYDALSASEQAVIQQQYDEKMAEIAGRHKINYLNGVPLEVTKVDAIDNEENGTSYVEIFGTRLDLSEPFVVRTRAPGIMRHFEDSPDLPQRVSFHRIVDRTRSDIRTSPIWVVHPIVSLTTVNPFAEWSKNGH